MNEGMQADGRGVKVVASVGRKDRGPALSPEQRKGKGDGKAYWMSKVVQIKGWERGYQKRVRGTPA